MASGEAISAAQRPQTDPDLGLWTPVVSEIEPEITLPPT